MSFYFFFIKPADDFLEEVLRRMCPILSLVSSIFKYYGRRQMNMPKRINLMAGFTSVVVLFLGPCLFDSEFVD